MIRRKPLKRKPWVRKIGAQRRRRLEEYRLAKREYLESHPRCERCDPRMGMTLAVDIHHKRGRIGRLLTDPAWFMAVCRECHAYIHFHPQESYERGWMVTRIGIPQ